MCTRSCKHIKLTRFAGKCGERQRAHARSSSSSAHPASTVLRFPKGSFGSSEPLFLLDGYDTEKKLSKQESQGQQRFLTPFSLVLVSFNKQENSWHLRVSRLFLGRWEVGVGVVFSWFDKAAF